MWVTMMITQGIRFAGLDKKQGEEMNLQYSRTVVIRPGVEGDVFITSGGREVAFIRDGPVTTARVEPWIHWSFRRLGLIKSEEEE